MTRTFKQFHNKTKTTLQHLNNHNDELFIIYQRIISQLFYKQYENAIFKTVLT